MSAIENRARLAVDSIAMSIEITACAFCARETVTRGHHVVPRSKGGQVVVPTCVSCEDFIHKTWSHNELRDTYNTVEKVRAEARFQRFLAWLQKQPGTAVHRSKRGRSRPGDRYK